MRSSRAMVALALLCAACDAETSGRRATFELTVAPAAPGTFHTTAGWDVMLEEACLSFGPVYFYEQPAFALAAPRVRRHGLLERFVPTAHAHPGVDHFNGGEVRGEWTEQIAIDLLGAERSLGPRYGVAGAVRSFTVGVNPPRASTDTRCLRGHQAYAIGVASRSDATIPFEGGFDIDEAGTKRRLQASVSADAAIDDGRTFVVTLDARPWFDAAQFDTLQPGEGARRVIEPAGQVWNAWSLGLQRAGALGLVVRDREP